MHPRGMNLGGIALATTLGFCLFATLAHSADATIDLPAGGLVLAPNAGLSLAEETVTIAPKSIKVRYVLANTTAADRTVLVTFPLPDIPMADTRDREFALPHNDPFNYVDFKTTVDGAPLTADVDQRALATGLDITQALTEAGIPLNPVAEGVVGLIATLSNDAKADFVERGIIELDGNTPIPLWTLRTTFHWRQKVAAGKTVTIEHAYLPVAGSAKATAESIEALRAPFCIDQATADKLKVRPQGVSWVTYLMTAGASSLGPAAKFSLRVEKRAPEAIASLCRAGLRADGAAALEWTATNYQHDEDIRVLFAN